MSVFIKTFSGRAANTFPRELIPVLCYFNSGSFYFWPAWFLHATIWAYCFLFWTLSLALRLQIHHKGMGLFIFLFCFGFFFLEDTVRKLCEYCGTAIPLHIGTKQDGTTEGAHKMTGQMSYEKKVPNSLRRFPYSENVNESHNEM